MKRVLIVCTGNSCRSQIAEGLINALWGDRWQASSAGTHPGVLNPRAVEVMADIGIDISHHRSKSIDEFAGQSFDMVVTVCDSARDECPFFPGAGETVHLPIADPAPHTDVPGETGLRHFKHARDQLLESLAEILAE